MKVTDIIRQDSFHPLKTGEKGTAKKVPKNGEDQKIRESAKQLEGLFLSFVLKAMEKTIPRDEKSSRNNLATMMFSSVMGQAMAENGGIGLADFLSASMVTHSPQEVEELQNKFQQDVLSNMRLNLENSGSGE